MSNQKTFLDEYEELINATAIYPAEKGIEYVTLGLVGEAGEIANKIKKVIRDSNGVISNELRSALIDEAGDVQWYLIALVCKELNCTFEEMLRRNMDKLYARKAKGTIQGSGDNR